MEPARRVFRDLARMVQSALLYPGGNDRLTGNAQLMLEGFQQYGMPLRVSLIGTGILIETITVVDPSPMEKLTIRKLRENDWEGLRIEKGVSVEGLLDLTAKLVSGVPPPIEGNGFNVGYLSFEMADNGGVPISNQVVGYLSLLAGARDTLSEIASGRPEGIEVAKDVVSGFAAYINSGQDMFGAIRNLKKYDDYTYTHALNVAIVAMAVAQALNVPEETLKTLALGALCHDVGKERIPKDILNKPSRLTDQEKAVMDRHPLEGARILLDMPVSIPELVPVIAYEHHISSQGGYPALLPGQTKHPASELISAVDVFDALRTIRPYRAAYSTEDAFSILLGDARKGKIDRRLLGPMAGVLKLAVPGKRVRLTNNCEAAIQKPNLKNPLAPVVVTDLGESIDLSAATGMGIAGFLKPSEDPPGAVEE